jgi:predicted NAD/FAD-binding protein
VRIAIVGSGIAGLTCGHTLHRHHDVTVFEADRRIGGHAHTVDVTFGDRTVPVDTGFIVFNRQNYPGFCRLLDTLGVPTKAAPMSFSVRDDRTGFEYGGGSLNALFAQRRNVVRPPIYRIVRDIRRFARDARVAQQSSATLGEHLERGGYSREFAQHYLLPMAGAIWSASTGDAGLIPVRFVVQFFGNHGMLEPWNRPQWYTIEGGSREYVARLTRPLGERVRTGCPVRRVERRSDHVLIWSAGWSDAERFDAVILACHAPQALGVLADATPVERQVLAALRTVSNEAVLHTDAAMLPSRRAAWSAWNYHAGDDAGGGTCVTYCLSILQSLDTPEPVCVTLNRTKEIDPSRVRGIFRYDHPVYDEPSMQARARRAEISRPDRRTLFAGAYWGNGFHEDGVQSGLDACRALGVGVA